MTTHPVPSTCPSAFRRQPPLVPSATVEGTVWFTSKMRLANDNDVRALATALDLTVDATLLWVGVLLALGASVMLAFVPRLPSSEASTGFGLSSGGVRITIATNHRLRLFAVTQIAASFVLLAGAGALLTALLAASDGVLDSITLRWKPEAALTVVMAARGYPGPVEKGSRIRGLEEAERLPDVIVFQAGTKAVEGRITAQGGRVLNVTATGRTITEARARAYAAIDRIDWPEGFCRRDIGWRAVEREQG